MAGNAERAVRRQTITLVHSIVIRITDCFRPLGQHEREISKACDQFSWSRQNIIVARQTGLGVPQLFGNHGRLARNLEPLAAAHILAGHHVVFAHHVGSGFGKTRAVAFIGTA